MANDKKKRSFSDKLMKVTTDRFSGSRLLLVYGGGAALIALWTIGLIILNGLGTTPAVVFAGVMGALTLVYVGYFFLGKHMRIALATTFIVFGLVWGVAAMRGDFAAEDRDNGRNDRLVIPVTPKPRTNDPLPPSIEPPTELPDGLVAHGSVGKVPIPVDDGKEDEKTIRGPTTGTEDNRIDITGSLGDPDKNDPSKTPDFSIAYSERPKIVDMVQPKYPDIARDMGIEGDVVLLVYIDETGTVRNALVQSSPELPAMEEEAVKAAYKCKFAPAKQQDRPVGVWYTIVMEFKR